MFCDNGCWKIPKGSPFQFFSALWDFLEFFYRSIFWCFATMDVKKCERIPLSVFSPLWDFFNPHELTKIVLQVLQNLMVPNWYIWPSELNQKGFSSFCVTYHTRRDLRVPLSGFFGTVRLFFRKKFFPKGSPFNFLMFCDRMDVEKSQRAPTFSFFSALWDFLEIFFTVQFFDVLQQWMLKNAKGFPFQFFSALWDFFNPHELTKIVLQVLQNLMVPNWYIWPSELNQKGFSSFCVTYHTRRDQRVPPFNFFRHCETFFSDFFS